MERGYIQLSRAWYARSVLRKSEYIDEVMFGFYEQDGDTIGELAMRWEKLQEDVVKIEIYGDAFHLLEELPDVFRGLAGRKYITPDEFCKLLDECGFTDRTQDTYKP